MIDGDNRFDSPGGSDPFALGGAGGSFGAKPKNKVSAQTVILGVIVVVGAGLLFGMRQFGMGPVLDLAEVKIDYEPNPENEKERVEFDEVLAQLNASNERYQIPPEWIERDPFVIPGSGAEDTPENVQIPAVDPNEAERRTLVAKVDQAIKNVDIQSAMGGRVSLARINGEMYEVGDAVEECLEIIGVEGRFVRFIGADGRIFEGEIGGELREIQLDGSDPEPSDSE